MDEKLEALAEYLSAALPGAVPRALIGTEIRYGELSCRVERDAVLRVLGFLRDDPKCRFTLLCDVCASTTRPVRRSTSFTTC
jgi:NADH-quinone oxidoreductase subunit C